MDAAGEGKFKSIFSKVMNVAPSESSENFSYGSPGHWDSIRHVELFILLMREFKVYFSPEEIAELSSYKLIKERIREKIQG